MSRIYDSFGFKNIILFVIPWVMVRVRNRVRIRFRVTVRVRC